jgi:thioredoxin reductase (NADPH)
VSDPSPPRDAGAGLSDEHLSILRRYGREADVPAGELLFRAGDAGYDFHVVLSGRVAVVENFGRRDERVLVEHGPRRFIGELNILTGQAVLLSAVVREPSRILTLTVEDLRKVIAGHTSLSEAILGALLVRRSLMLEARAGLRVVGSRYSVDARRLLEYLARNRVPHVWLDLEEDPDAEGLLREFDVRPEDTPLVIWRGGAVLRNPRNVDVARTIGLASRPAEVDLVDLVIVGAGPAGLAAGVSAGSEGLRTLILESVAVGGQAGTSTRIENYLGFPAGLSGSDLVHRAAVQAEKFHATVATPRQAVSLRTEGATHIVGTDDGGEVASRAVLIATGARYRRLELPGIRELEGVGVYYAATEMEAQACAAGAVAIVGGGNSAGQAAVYLAERVEHVYVLIRAEKLAPAMSRYLAVQVERHPKITLLARTRVRAVHGEGVLEGITIDAGEGEQRRLDVGGLFVFIGAEPHTAWLAGELALDEAGFILTGRDVPLDRIEGPPPTLLETSRPGVYAAGDTRSGSLKRVASAVGEGSMCGRLALEYLGAAAGPGLAAPPRPWRQMSAIIQIPVDLRR